jgi:hypothetical protein
MFCCLFLLISRIARANDYNYFIDPHYNNDSTESSLQVYSDGSVMNIQWRTIMGTYSIALWQELPGGISAQMSNKTIYSTLCSNYQPLLARGCAYASQQNGPPTQSWGNSIGQYRPTNSIWTYRLDFCWPTLAWRWSRRTSTLPEHRSRQSVQRQHRPVRVARVAAA